MSCADSGGAQTEPAFRYGLCLPGQRADRVKSWSGTAAGWCSIGSGCEWRLQMAAGDRRRHADERRPACCALVRDGLDANTRRACRGRRGGLNALSAQIEDCKREAWHDPGHLSGALPHIASSSTMTETASSSGDPAAGRPSHRSASLAAFVRELIASATLPLPAATSLNICCAWPAMPSTGAPPKSSIRISLS